MPRSNRRPWSSFYWADWLADSAVQTMTFDQQGRYFNVLAWTHQTNTPGRMTEDQVRRWAGYSSDEWADHRDIMAACFEVSGEHWVQKRVVREARLAAAFERNQARDRQRRWRLTHPDSVAEYNASRRDARRNARRDGGVTRNNANCPATPISTTRGVTLSQSQSQSQEKTSGGVPLSGVGELNQAPELDEPRRRRLAMLQSQLRQALIRKDGA